MPEISRFYGIRVTMYYNDHVPPHFHAAYEGRNAQFLLNGQVHHGSLPVSAMRLVREWAQQHTGELEANWARALAEQALVEIKPLD